MLKRLTLYLGTIAAVVIPAYGLAWLVGGR